MAKPAHAVDQAASRAAAQAVVGGWRPWVAVVATLGLWGCYGHARTPSQSAWARPELPQARQGRYVIRRAGRVVAEERVTITSTQSWIVEGSIRRRGPVSAQTDYRLEVDPVGLEPVRLNLSLSIADQTRTSSATVRQGYLHSETSGIGPRVRRAVPYAKGTALDAVSPVLRSWVLASLGARLEPGRDIRVRTVRFPGPLLEPVVQVQVYRSRRTQGGLRLVEVLGPGGVRQEALWVQPDGFVVRARVWPTGPRGRFEERRWVSDQVESPRD